MRNKEGMSKLLTDEEHQLNLKTELRSSSKKTENKSKMNPRVLDTWINETLQDAEHMDIPGVILKSD